MEGEGGFCFGLLIFFIERKQNLVRDLILHFQGELLLYILIVTIQSEIFGKQKLNC